MPRQIHSKTTRDTFDAGSAFAESLTPGAIVALYGDLGAGKTEFVKGVCSGLGIEADTVTSPTFAIVNEYKGGSLPVFHFDVYRLKTIDELYEFGYEDYFYGDGVCLIEWPALIEELLPKQTIRIHFEHRQDGRLIQYVDP
jgi:tRNA threonylcarbamoyladenosine biosynthesis protein TsaE